MFGMSHVVKFTYPAPNHQIAEEAGASAASVSFAAIRAKRTVNPFAAATAGEEDTASDPRRSAPAASGSTVPKRAAAAGALSGDAALRVPTREVRTAPDKKRPIIHSALFGIGIVN